jgi:hypothetical protein
MCGHVYVCMYVYIGGGFGGGGDVVLAPQLAEVQWWLSCGCPGLANPRPLPPPRPPTPSPHRLALIGLSLWLLYPLASAASIARKLYLRQGLGVGMLSRVYGGGRRNGTRPKHFQRSSRGLLRHILHQLEANNIIERIEETGCVHSTSPPLPAWVNPVWWTCGPTVTVVSPCGVGCGGGFQLVFLFVVGQRGRGSSVGRSLGRLEFYAVPFHASVLL